MADWLGVDVSQRICTVAGCEKSVHGQGLCGTHYRSLKRYGDPLGLQRNGSCSHCGQSFTYRGSGKPRTACSDACHAALRLQAYSRYREANHEKRAAYDRARDPERQRERYTLYREANQAELNARARARREADPERHREIDRCWKRRNPAKVLHRSRLQRATRARVRIYEFTIEELERRLSMFAGCWICGHEWTEIDHVKPVTAGGPHMLANIRPACRRCNNRKRRKWPLMPDDLVAIAAA